MQNYQIESRLVFQPMIRISESYMLKRMIGMF